MTKTDRRESRGWLLAVALLLLAAPALAQDPAQLAKVPPRERATIQTTFLADALHLSDEQRAKVDAINLKYAEQMQPLLQGSTWTLMREGKKVDEAKDADLRAVLTPEQFQTYLGVKDALRDRLKQRAAAVAAGGNP